MNFSFIETLIYVNCCNTPSDHQWQHSGSSAQVREERKNGVGRHF